MAMVVKNNLSAVRTLNVLNSNSSALQKGMARVSSGMKITGAQDDAAGFAISERMRVRIRALDQANQNTQNDSALMKTAEGAVGNTIDILKALKEKCINAANDSNTDEDRQTIQKEIDQYIDQIDDNALVTFNGKYLIDGSKNNAAVETKTILLNQSLSTATTSQTALTDLASRTDESLGILSTDYYQVSWVQNGQIHTTSGQVKDSTIDSILKDAQLDGTVAATTSDGLIRTTDEGVTTKTASGMTFTAVPSDATSGNEFGDIVGAGKILSDSGLTGVLTKADVGTSVGDEVTINGYYMKNDDGEYVEVTMSLKCEATETSSGSGDEKYSLTATAADGADVTKFKDQTLYQNPNTTLDTIQYEDDGNGNLTPVSADEAGTDSYIDAPTETSIKITDTTADNKFTFDASHTWNGTASFKALSDEVGETVANNIPTQSELDAIADKINDGAYYVMNDEDDPSKGFTKAVMTVSINNGTGIADFTGSNFVGKTLYKLDNPPTGTTIATVTGGAGNLDEPIAYGAPTVLNVEVKSDEEVKDVCDKYNKDVYTPDGTQGMAVVAKKAGVDDQISGLTISILDQDHNVKKAANAALDQFKQYQRAENVTGDKSLNFHIGSEANQAIKVGLTDMRAQALGLKGADGTRINVFTKENANASINVIENALTKALDQQTTIGAVESRLEYTSTNLTTASENVQASESTIRDADMAKEMTNYTKANVLLQAAQAMLAQANQSSSSVLSLLQ